MSTSCKKEGMSDGLTDLSRRLRVELVKMFHRSGTGHLAPALSCLDILTALYFGGAVDRSKKGQADRDRVILSKGHGCAALYVVLAEAGFFPKEELATFYQPGTRLQGHPSLSLPGIETATGSLGHGLCFATGTALAAKLDGLDYQNFVIIGDGETQEGSVWEAAMFAANHGLDNLKVILDYNRLQASDHLEKIAGLEPVADKWAAFGWCVERVGGHDLPALAEILKAPPAEPGRPTLIIADTVKGMGLSLMAGHSAWHCRVPQGDQWASVLQDLGLEPDELRRP